LATNDLSASPPRNQRGYLRSNENVLTLKHDTSDANNNTTGSGFTSLLTSVSKPPTADGGADGYGLGNFTVDTASSDATIVGTTFSSDISFGGSGGNVACGITAVNGANKPTEVEILPTAGGSTNSNRVRDADWAGGTLTLKDTATQTVTLVLNLETTTGSTDLTLLQEGQVAGMTMINGGSGYKVGDTLILDTLAVGQQDGGAWDLSDGSGGVGGSKTFITVTQVGDAGGSGGKGELPLGSPFSIFTGGYGTNIKNPAKNNSNQFIVVEQYGASPTAFVGFNITNGDTFRGETVYNGLAGSRVYLQFMVNTTGYFKDPDGVVRNGIPANIHPYPETAQNYACSKKEIPVYILPGQTWDTELILFNGDALSNTQSNKVTGATVRAFLKYTLYDGPDCLIAMKLLQSGIPITPENVDEFKRKIIETNIMNENS
tara:strand:- start:652 stop:1947 length:1296 start_codon:yes stop_codon:yes gene_type:complete